LEIFPANLHSRKLFFYLFLGTLHDIRGLLAAQWDINYMHAVFWDRIVPSRLSYVRTLFKDERIEHEIAQSRSAFFKCSMCEKKFTRQSRLRDHESTHQGVKVSNHENGVFYEITQFSFDEK